MQSVCVDPSKHQDTWPFLQLHFVGDFVGINSDMGWAIKAHYTNVNDATNTAIEKALNVEITTCIGTEWGVSGNKGT